MRYKHSIQLFKSANGNGVLELLLFTPLFLLFTFVVVDAGLSLADKAAFTDSIRAGLNTEGLYIRQFPAVRLNPISNSLEVNRGNLSALLDNLSSQIVRAINRAQGFAEDSEPETFSVELAAFALTIDQQTGALALGSELLDSVTRGEFNSNAVDPHYPLISREQYLEESIARQSEVIPSPYAIAAPNLVSGGGFSSQNTPAYLNQSVVVYAEVKGLTRGINFSATRSIIGKSYMYQGQELRPLRSQVM